MLEIGAANLEGPFINDQTFSTFLLIAYKTYLVCCLFHNEMTSFQEEHIHFNAAVQCFHETFLKFHTYHLWILIFHEYLVKTMLHEKTMLLLKEIHPIMIFIHASEFSDASWKKYLKYV